jgi:hypothetical protein
MTLKRRFPTVTSLLKGFSETVELQEPTFQDVVVVYRWGRARARVCVCVQCVCVCARVCV